MKRAAVFLLALGLLVLALCPEAERVKNPSGPSGFPRRF